MKKMSVGSLALGLLATAFLVGQAQAADLPVKARTYSAPAAPAPTWTGFYVGVNGGYGGDKVSYPFTIGPVAGSADLTSSGFFAGGQAGYNWQFAPTWVAGIETDIQWSDIQSKIDASANIAGANLSAGTKLNYFGTVRGRVGYLVTPAALLYATGGWAYGQTTTSLSAGAFGFGIDRSFEHTKSGWTGGGGLEYALTNRISMKTEYLYMDLGTNDIVSGTVFGIPGSISEKTTVHTFKVGLNLKLGAM